ncbi:hypothetical protein ACF09I_35575 [Streptomyces sp. NPDC014940]|uniref:hypothetical protein n=1 Tax=Streptomyces sp. NPDC014940 TaxID=3364932 RepID=UPI0036FBB433
MGRKSNNVDDFPASREEWETRIATRSEVVKEARQSGDPAFVARAEGRLDSALDGYNRDVK